ncbi:MAG: DUF4249 domain-containing protein [Ignavibacteriae bacterium]|nr:DUF4249 domain-containing protein [Ignavibacteriota bacterium]
MKNFLKIFSIIFISISCESVVDVELPKQNPLIVVNSFFTPDSVFKVHVSKSLGILESFSVLNEYGYNEDKIPILENAKVEIWNGDNIVTNLNYSGNGFYIAQNTFPQINNNYKIVVSADGFKSVFAEDKIPNSILIKNVLLESNPLDEYLSQNEITIIFEDDGNTKNYYQLSLFAIENFSGEIYRTNLFFESNDILIGESDIFDENEKTFYGYAAYFDDAIISGKEYKLKISTYEISYYSEVYVILSSLSENLYKYIISVKEQDEADDNPFAEPVSIHNNVQNGLGIFGGYSSSVYRIK